MTFCAVTQYTNFLKNIFGIIMEIRYNCKLEKIAVPQPGLIKC